MFEIPDLHNWINYLPEPVKADVLRQMKPRRYTDGEAVYSVGEPANGCFLIEAGKVRICNYTDDGREFQIIELHSGECFGEIALVDDLPRFNSAVAAGDTLLQMLPKTTFHRLHDDYREIARALNMFFALRFRTLYMNTAEANLLTLKQRLVRTIATLGYNGREDNGRRIIESVSHQTLALMLGATRQGVSRELKVLERAGMIELHYGRIVVLNIEELAQQCEHLVSGGLVVTQRSRAVHEDEMS